MPNSPPPSLPPDKDVAGTLARRVTFSVPALDSRTLDQESSELTSENSSELDITLEDRLRGILFQHQDGQGFLPAKLLAKILTLADIASKLEGYELGHYSAVTVARTIRGDEGGIEPAGDRTETYLVVFALLVLLERTDDIWSLMQLRISDDRLPLLLVGHKRNHLCLRESPEQALPCFSRWKSLERDYFAKWQYRLLVPYFEPDTREENGRLEMTPRHYQFPEYTILPWCAGRRPGQQDQLQQYNKGSVSVLTTMSEKLKMGSEYFGSEAKVTCVKIVNDCHGLHEMLSRANVSGPLFALKILDKSNDEQDFRRELEQLKHLNGRGHQHLVTLLTTFEFRDIYHFLFPCAEGSLEDYWEKQTPQPSNVVWARWLAAQLAGITDGIDNIHNPSHTPTKFGRHGDLKPDNILWYKRKADPLGNLVIADYGLSALNSATSRSNIPNRSVKHNPDYRPPECEIEGAMISQAYDIWNLGCVFMEMVVWFLGGSGLLERFVNDRYSPEFGSGVETKLFYEIQRYQSDDADGETELLNNIDDVYEAQVQYTISLKGTVMEWFENIHSHPACTQFIHDVANTIESKMLIVLSEGRARSRSRELKTEFASFLSACADTAEYCSRTVPRQGPHRARSSALVEAILNSSVREIVEKNRASLRVSSGPVLSAPRQQDLLDTIVLS